MYTCYIARVSNVVKLSFKSVWLNTNKVNIRYLIHIYNVLKVYFHLLFYRYI